MMPDLAERPDLYDCPPVSLATFMIFSSKLISLDSLLENGLALTSDCDYLSRRASFSLGILSGETFLLLTGALPLLVG